MSRPDTTDVTGYMAGLARLPHDEEGPVFAEPWQAQAFALTVRLSGQGYFTWTEWAEALSEQIRAARDRGEADDGSRYYEYWLAALEQMVTTKDLAAAALLDERKEAWIDAYHRTPHGHPVELSTKLD